MRELLKLSNLTLRFQFVLFRFTSQESHSQYMTSTNIHDNGKNSDIDVFFFNCSSTRDADTYTTLFVIRSAYVLSQI